MEFYRITIHQIKKRQGISHTELVPSQNLITIDENVESLIEKLNDAFNKDEKVIRTEFIDEKREFQGNIRAFVSNQTDEIFFDFSTNSLGRINDLLTGANLATGGYFVYANYLYRNKHYASVFLVRDVEEIIFDRSTDGTSFIVNTTTVINTKNLAMAARVDLTKLANNDERYVHFTFKQSDVSEYFVTWIEIHLSDKSKEDAETLIKLINSVAPYPNDPDTDEPFEREKFRNKIFDYIQASGRVVKLSDVSNTFWGSRDYLSDLAVSKGLDINQEFRAPSASLNKLRKFRLKSGKMNVSFSQSDIENGRIFAGDSGQVILENAAIRRQFDNLNG